MQDTTLNSYALSEKKEEKNGCIKLETWHGNPSI